MQADRDLERRLEAIAANQKLPLETRETAERHLEGLRHKNTTNDGGNVDGGIGDDEVDRGESQLRSPFLPHFFSIVLLSGAAITFMASLFGQPVPEPAVLLIAFCVGSGLFPALVGFAVYYLVAGRAVGRRRIGAAWGGALFVTLLILVGHLNR